MLENNYTTTLSSIILLILKELRLERSMHQAQLAEACDKTPSAWTKIELGKNSLSMEIFFRVCNTLQVAPSSVLSTAERHSALLSQNGWWIMSKQLDFSDDDLLQIAQKYYSSENHKNRQPIYYYNTILNEPVYLQNGQIEISPLFEYVLNPQSNKLLDRNI